MYNLWGKKKGKENVPERLRVKIRIAGKIGRERERKLNLGRFVVDL